MRLGHRAIDIAVAACSVILAPFLFIAARYRWNLRLARRVHDAIGVTVVRNHYYEPVFTQQDLPASSDCVRYLPGIDMNRAGQMALLDRLVFADELKGLDGADVDGRTYRYTNQRGMFGEGDADVFYSIIRSVKPSTLVEIGCGQSSLVAQLAFRKNTEEDPAYKAHHICIEPYHNGWLDGIGADFWKEKVENVDLDIFRNLKENDIVFIDSSHVLRPGGDVECEFLKILPVLPVGVMVHIHDIYTPRNYLEKFMSKDRRFWNEQYVLEAFLTLNPHYEVALALHDLHARREPKLYEAVPILAQVLETTPGSFWIRRRS